MTMSKISYAPDEKILSIRLSNAKSVDSDIVGNVVIDYGKNDEIVNIEIMNIRLDEFKKTRAPLADFMKISRAHANSVVIKP